MVGVPGRSKACSTCRRRKKGCDYARPVCTQCLTAGIECGGYQRERIFVHADEKSWVATGGKSEYTPKRKPKPPTTTVIPNQDAQSVVVLPNSLHRTAFEDCITGLYWQLFLPGGRSLSHSTILITGGSWTSLIPQWAQHSPALHLSLLANCLCSVGVRDRQPWLIQEGMRIYGKALQATMAALTHTDPAVRQHISLLPNSKLLTQFEIFHGADVVDKLAQSRSFTRHTAGELALFLARGPEMFVRGDAHRLFSDARINLAILDTKERRPSPLNEKVWKTVPWREARKTMKDELVDVYLEIPGLLYQVDVVRAGLEVPEALEDLKFDISEKCWELDTALEEWHAKYVPDLPPAEELFRRARKEVDSGFPDVAYSEADFAATHILTLYWVTCVMTYSTLLSFAPTPSPNSSLDPLPDRIKNTHQYIRNIALAAPLLVNPACGWFGKSLAAFPIGLALQFLLASEKVGEVSEERRLLNELLSSNRGKEVKEFLVSLQRDNARAGRRMMLQDGEEGSVGRARVWAWGRALERGW